jgi:hypothetical protein
MTAKHIYWQENIPNGQIYTNSFDSMAFQNISEPGIFGMQIYHLATPIPN